MQDVRVLYRVGIIIKRECAAIFGIRHRIDLQCSRVLRRNLHHLRAKVRCFGVEIVGKTGDKDGVFEQLMVYVDGSLEIGGSLRHMLLPFVVDARNAQCVAGAGCTTIQNG